MSERRTVDGSRGFTLIEILVVVGIISILLAVMTPRIYAFLQNYQIHGAEAQVAALFQSARLKALSRNANLGVVAAFPSATTFQYALEDDASPQLGHACTPTWSTWAAECGGNFLNLLTDPVQGGPVGQLPVGLTLVTPATCAPVSQVTEGAPNEWGIRFNRLGGACGVSTTCNPAQKPPGTGGITPWIYLDATTGTATVCVLQTATGLFGSVIVSATGRTVSRP